MNTPNTTTPSRIELGSCYWEEGIGSSPGSIYSPKGEILFPSVSRKRAEVFAAAMNRPAPQQAPVRSAEVQRVYDQYIQVPSQVAWGRGDIAPLLAYIATLEANQSRIDAVSTQAAFEAGLQAHSPVNTAQPAGSVLRDDDVVAAGWLANAWLCGESQKLTKAIIDPRKTMARGVQKLIAFLNKVTPFDMADNAKAENAAALTQPVNTGPSADWRDELIRDIDALVRPFDKGPGHNNTTYDLVKQLTEAQPSAASGGAEEAAREIVNKEFTHGVFEGDFVKVVERIQRAIDGAVAVEKAVAAKVEQAFQTFVVKTAEDLDAANKRADEAVVLIQKLHDALPLKAQSAGLFVTKLKTDLHVEAEHFVRTHATQPCEKCGHHKLTCKCPALSANGEGGEPSIQPTEHGYDLVSASGKVLGSFALRSSAEDALEAMQ